MSAPQDKPFRVIHLCAVDFTVRQFIAPLALRQEREAGYQVTCACTKGPHWEELAAMGVRMKEMPIARSASLLPALRSVVRVARWLRNERPDALHCHTPVASMIGRLAGRIAGVPLIIYTAHGFYFHEDMEWKRRAAHITLEWLFGQLHHALFCVSREDAEFARGRRFAKPERIFFISNGADLTKFHRERIPGARNQIRQEFAIPESAVLIMIMGRMVREKGYLELFRAARKLPANAWIMAVGDTVVGEHDDAKSAILRAAEAPELRGRVVFTGMRSDIPELLAASDIFCLPTYREGMPVSTLEAMAMGLPVVTTDIRGCREEIRDGKTGYLLKPRAVRPLARKLRRLVGSPKLRQEMGAAARADAERYFDREIIERRILEIYKFLRHPTGDPPPWQDLP